MCTYTVRFARHMEGTTLELTEVLKEDAHESRDVLGSLFGRTLSSC